MSKFHAREKKCVREGLTLDIDGGTETLIVDCSIHGEIGRIPFGGDEFGNAEALFAEHVAAAFPELGEETK